MLNQISATATTFRPLAQTLAVQANPQPSASSSTPLTSAASAQDSVTLSLAAQALSQYQQGKTILQIAGQLGVDIVTVSSYLGLANSQQTADSQISAKGLSAYGQAGAYLQLASIQGILEGAASLDSTNNLLQAIQGTNLPLTGESQGSSTLQDYLQQGFSADQAYQISRNQALMDTLSSQSNTIDFYF